MPQLDSGFKEVIAPNATAAEAINDGYTRLESLRRHILEQTMDDTAYLIGIRIRSESMAIRRKQKDAA